MKKLLKKLCDWLIVKLGGVTGQEVSEAIEDWSNEVNAYIDHVTRLDLELSQEKEKNKNLQMELNRNLTEWKMLRAERVFRQTPETGIELVEFVKDDLAQKILNMVKPCISYQFMNDFDGNTRAIAALRFKSGEVPLWGPGE